MRNFVTDVFSVGISKLLIITFGLAISVIIARVLGPEKNGIIASLLVFPSLFMSIGSLGIRQSTTYFLGKGIFTEEAIKQAITQIWLMSTIFSVVVCFFLVRYFCEAGEDSWLVFLALLPIPFKLFNTYNSGIFLGKNDIGSFNKVNWIPTSIILVLTAVLVIWLSYDIQGYLLALTGGPLIISLILLFKNKFIQAFNVDVNWMVIKKMLSLGLIYAIALLVISLNYRIDVILLDNLSSDFETGIYAKGVSVAEYLWQIPMLLSAVVFARSAVSKNNKDFSIKVLQLLRVSFIVISLVAVILSLISEFIITTLFGAAFLNSSEVLNVLLPGIVLLTVFKVINMDLSGKGKPWIALKAMIPALMINIVLNVVLIPNYGANGAAIASTISYSCAAALFIWLYSKEIDIPLIEIFSFKRSDFKPVFQYLSNRLSK